MIKKSESSQAIGALVMLWSLIFLAHFWEGGLKIDSMTYSAVAKNMVESGNWWIPHYTRSAYNEFYQHPPLGLWIQALFFSLFGISEITARLFPAFTGLGTVLGVYFLGKKIHSPFFGFIASLITLTSIRYIKYATDFYLDGPLACFMIWSAVCFVTLLKSKDLNLKLFPALGFGIFFFFAFMTKGLFAFAVPAAAGLSLLPLLKKWNSNKSVFAGYGMGLIFAMTLFGVWYFLLNGQSYFEQYWLQHVKGSISSSDASHYWLPLKSLSKTYWPWLPFFILGFFAWAKRVLSGKELLKPMTFIIFCCLIFLIAFAKAGKFLEHYLVSFYPFAALVAASAISEFLDRYKTKLYLYTKRGAIAAAFALAVLPISLHKPRYVELKSILDRISELCPSAEKNVQDLLITSQAREQWGAYAVVAWKTKWNPISVNSIPLPKPQQLLIADRSQNVPSAWKKIPFIQNRTLQVYQGNHLSICSN